MLPGLIEIYPREGTETLLSTLISALRMLKFIPVRGRKLFLGRDAVGHQVEIYPREGTETRACCMDRGQSEVEIYPREGTETMGIKTLAY